MAIEGLYPLSSQDGRAIPLEIIKPSSLIYWNLAINVEKTIVIPVGFELCFAICTTNCLIRNSTVSFGAPAEATAYADAMLLPAENAITLNLTPGADRRIYPLGNGVLYLSAIKHWAALVQDMQTRLG